mmetsp:Transcript_59014/g.71030  ORF Transcript_59014/g.71030 Transcript_59014/m.71030 type:complete len:259 (+) Transcript_59014:3-779(+)
MLHRSLVEIGKQTSSTSSSSTNCSAETLELQCINEMIMTPMCPADYIMSGDFPEEEWRHFALNIPYYTHFTSPIRRYADVMVHRLLYATLQTNNGSKRSINGALTRQRPKFCRDAHHCNEKRMAAKAAQERGDRIYLSLYLKHHPINSTLGVVLSVKDKGFNVFVPELGMTSMVFLDDHLDRLTYTLLDSTSSRSMDDMKRIRLVPLKATKEEGEIEENNDWSTELIIEVFQKVCVSCVCKPTSPINVRFLLKGPWID